MEPTVTIEGEGGAPATPTQRIVQDANGIARVTDSRGRAIGVRRMSMSLRRRTLKALSSQSSEKNLYLGMVMLAACVVDIDGQNCDAFATPGNIELRLDALIDRLEDEGFEAVSRAIDELTPKAASADDLKKS